MKHSDELDIRLIGVSEVKRASVLHHWEMMRYEGGKVNVGLSASFNMSRESSIATVIVGVHYTTLRSQVIRKLMDYTVKACFEISDLQGLVDIEYGDILIPPGLLHLMLSVSIGALRGMLALRTANTFLAHYPLPLMDLTEIMSHMDMGIGRVLTPLQAYTP